MEGANMIVRKIRNKNEFGKVTLTASEMALIRKLGLKIEEYVKHRLIQIAKKRKWKWYFEEKKI
jgi:hypothetical protein